MDAPRPTGDLVVECAVEIHHAAGALRAAARRPDPATAALAVSQSLERTADRLAAGFGVAAAVYARLEQDTPRHG